MPTDDDRPLQLSLLDRLLDDDPTNPQNPRKTRAQTHRELLDSVRRDLEAMLNTHPCSTTWDKGFAHLESSILNYGVPILGSTVYNSEANRERFCREVEAAIRRFEPRFLWVSVSLIPDTDRLDRMIYFRVEAHMRAEPAPEPLVFDSVMDPSTLSISIAAARDV